MEEKQAQLEWEARAGRLAGYAAWGAAALLIAALVYQLTVLPRGGNTVAKLLPLVKTHKTDYVLYGFLTALGILALIPPLLYLFRATRFRRPELPGITRILIIAGPLLLAVAAAWGPFRQAHAADQFVSGAVKTNKHAKDLVSHASTAVAIISLPGALFSAIAVVLVSINSLRAGLLSRFMGVLGVILGALYVLPLAPAQVIQVFWLAALGALFLDKWPGGRGPAWETGEAVPWPSPQRGLGPAPSTADEDEDRADTEPEPQPEPAAARANPNASRKRKKRKARR